MDSVVDHSGGGPRDTTGASSKRPTHGSSDGRPGGETASEGNESRPIGSHGLLARVKRYESTLFSKQPVALCHKPSEMFFFSRGLGCVG